MAIYSGWVSAVRAFSTTDLPPSVAATIKGIATTRLLVWTKLVIQSIQDPDEGTDRVIVPCASMVRLIQYVSVLKLCIPDEEPIRNSSETAASVRAANGFRIGIRLLLLFRQLDYALPVRWRSSTVLSDEDR